MERKKVAENIWEIPVSHKQGMRVPARIVASDNLMNNMDEGVINQITNVACLPGIKGYAWCMPDGHHGYGFPIGGVAAFDTEKGIISPGGIGFDINCGVRMMSTNLTEEEVRPKLRQLIDGIFSSVPAGVGKSGFVRLNRKSFEDIMTSGATWCHKNGYAFESDLDHIEQRGKIPGADPSAVSDKAFKRGVDQMGTLGSGNHYLEIQTVRFDEGCDRDIAEKLGVREPGQIVIMIHCGSRGFGHQIGTDYLQSFGGAMQKYGIKTNDRELACAPIGSPEGKAYFGAMACAANTAFANRQVITDSIRKCFSKAFEKPVDRLGMSLIYDVAHNIAKFEKYDFNGKLTPVLVHRKGATRAFGPGNPELSGLFREIGQPVLVGGSMQTGSYLLVGTKKAEQLTFGSTLHGAGRVMSRSRAKRQIRGSNLQQIMEKEGIIVKAASFAGLAEEAGFAYKDVSEVVKVVDKVGISKKVARLLPLANIKG
ncbi:MAG: RtcB family protein [Candidatus Zixiibacteriota bacterium]|nr:MAG: RtcB family protein [candidate division Zixibacteria bacterium]